MAITFVGRGTTIHNNTGNSETVSMPAAVSAGDLFVGIAYLEDEILSGGSASTPVTINFNVDQLSAQERVISGTASSDNSTIYVFAKTLTSTDMVSGLISVTNSSFDAEDIILEHFYFSGDIPTTITDVTKNQFTAPPQVTSNATSLTTRIGGGSSDLTISGSDAWNTTHYDHGSVSIHAYHHKNKRFTGFSTTPSNTDTNWIIREAGTSVSNTSASTLAVYKTNDTGLGTSLELQVVTTTNQNAKNQVGVVFAIPRTIAQSVDHPSTKTETASSADSFASQKAVSQTKTETSTTSDSLSLLLEANSLETETATTQDSLTLNQVAEESILDSVQVSDSLTASTIKVFEKTETSDATDSLSTQNTGSFSKSDTSGTLDVLSVTKSDSESNTDTASTSDTLNAFVSKPFIKTETSETNDTLLVTKSAGFVKTESASTSDTLEKTNVGALDFVDTGSASDVYTDSETADVSETDTTETSDTLTLFKQGGVSFTETSSTDDDGFSAVKQSSTSNTFNETDPSNATDTLSVVKQSSFNKTETASGSDLIDIDEVAEVSYVDTSSVSDSLSVNVSHSFSKTESASTEDLKTSPSEKQAVFSDTTNSADSRLFVRTIAVGLIDTGSGSDGFVDQVDQERNFVDTSSSGDTLVAEEPERREITATIVGNGGIDPNLMTEVQALATIDVWNVALNALGISTLEDTAGSNPQQTLLQNTFPLFRKQFLSDHLWNGAKKTADLTALTVNSTDQAVANRWKYVYQLPTDCMRVWRLNGQENKPVHVGGNANIYTNRWEIEVVEVASTKYRALCTNEDEARIEYVFDVDGDIDLLGPLTQHAMGMALAAFVATNFGKSASEIAQLEAQAKDAITAAKGVDGQEGTPQMFGDTSLLGVRSIGY